jgi:hypothetical protein
MSVKFKLSSSANKKSVDRVLGTLVDRGLVAQQLFPMQQRPSLARMYVIRSPTADVKVVQKVLEPFGSAVEYVEASVDRKPL